MLGFIFMWSLQPIISLVRTEKLNPVLTRNWLGSSWNCKPVAKLAFVGDFNHQTIIFFWHDGMLLLTFSFILYKRVFTCSASTLAPIQFYVHENRQKCRPLATYVGNVVVFWVRIWWDIVANLSHIFYFGSISLAVRDTIFFGLHYSIRYNYTYHIPTYGGIKALIDWYAEYLFSKIYVFRCYQSIQAIPWIEQVQVTASISMPFADLSFCHSAHAPSH